MNLVKQDIEKLKGLVASLERGEDINFTLITKADDSVQVYSTHENASEVIGILTTATHKLVDQQTQAAN